MPGRRGERVTLTEVAKRTGVSLSTVSKVLNGRADVADATRDAVERVFVELGYVSRTDRRSPSRRPSLLLILGNGVNPYAAQILEGVIEEARDLGVTIAITRADAPDTISPSALVQELANNGHAGVILVTPDFTDEDLAFLARRRVPMAMIDPVDPIHGEGVSVGSANWSGGLTATRYLIDQGHRRIGFVGGPRGSLVGQAREHGYHAALEGAGIPYDRSLVTQAPFRYAPGHDQGEQLLSLDEPPTAIFAASDLQALGVMAAARERGLAIPRDLSVIGYDDTWAAEWTVPALTTIRQPMAEMGRAAVRSVVAQIVGGAPPTRRVELNTELVVRGSVTAPRS